MSTNAELFVAALRRSIRRYLGRPHGDEDLTHVKEMLAATYRPQEPAQ